MLAVKKKLNLLKREAEKVFIISNLCHYSKILSLFILNLALQQPCNCQIKHNQSKKERQFELSHQDIPGITSLGRFEQSRLNHPLPFRKGRSLKMLMLKCKLTSTSNANLPTLYQSHMNGSQLKRTGMISAFQKCKKF